MDMLRQEEIGYSEGCKIEDRNKSNDECHFLHNEQVY
jgi:hypothetical protein